MTAAGPGAPSSQAQSPHPAFRGLIYSQCWEDPETVRAALQISPQDDVLVITSGGCNALALGLERPRSITAVDLNPLQNHLLSLKLAAIQSLDHESLLQFLGARHNAGRLRTYEMLRQRLPPEARDFWDCHQKQVRQGVIHSGRFERYLGLFRRLVLPLTHSRRQTQQLLRLGDTEEQRRFYEQVWDNRRWRLLFRLFFGRFLQGRIGRRPEFFTYVTESDFGSHYLQRTRHVLTEIPIRGNYFLEYIVTGGYAGGEDLPPYLRKSSLEALRTISPRLRVVTAELSSFLKSVSSGAFSCFYLSDIFEYMSAQQCDNTFQEIARVARDGARLCYYNNLIPRSHPGSLDGVIQADEDLGRRLHWRDRSFFYSRFVVERVRP